MKNLYRTTVLILIFLSRNFQLHAQTTPPAQLLEYNQTFTIASNSTVYPTGWQGWSLGTAASASFRTTAPTANLALMASSTAATTNGGVHNYNGKIGILSTASSDPSLALGISTTGKFSIQVRFDAMTIRNPWDGTTNTMINGLELQYRVGSIANPWNSATGMVDGFYQNIMVNQTTAVTTPQNNIAQAISLPPACDNQSAVYLRWVVRDISGSGNRPSFAIDNVVICPIATPGITITGPNASCSAQTMHYVAAPVNGGTTPSYSWKKNGTTIGTNSQNFSTAGLIAGDQISCVLTSNQGCLTSTTATSNIITIVNAAAPIINSATATNTCAGKSTGAVNLTVSGGTVPYVIAWDTSNTNGNVLVVTVGSETAANPNPPGIGVSFYVNGIETKELFLTKGLPYDFSVSGGHPFHLATLNIGALGTPNIVTNGQTGAPTGGGTVNFRPNGLHPAQIYYPCGAHVNMGWNINIGDGLLVEDPSGLKSGIYKVLVTDANGCTATATSTVGSNANPTPTITGTTTFCQGGSTTLDAGAGFTNYSWSTGASTQTINVNTAGTFTVTVTNANGCTGSTSKTTTVNPNPNPSITGTLAFCQGSSTTLDAGAGFSIYSWSTGASTRMINVSTGATFTVTVTNGTGCTASTSTTTTVNPNPTPSIATTLAVCPGAFTLLDAGAGFSVYNWSTGAHTQTINVNTAGTFTVSVTDGNGCTGSDQYTNSVIPALSLSAVIIDENCDLKDGSVDLTVSGGTGPYTICWDTVNTDNGAMFIVGFAPKTAAHPLFGQGSANGYLIDFVEGKELFLTRGISYSFSVATPNHPFRITTDLAGGTPNNVVSNGQTGAPTQLGTVLFKPDNSHPSQLYYSCEFHQFMGYNVNIDDGYCIEDLANRHAGTYSVIVTDANGCTASAQYTVNESAPLSLNANITDVSCNGARTGAIDLDVSGGTGPYTVCWDTSNQSNGGIFQVSFGPKTAAHPLFGQGSGNGYIIDNVEGPELNLTRGFLYSFNVITPNHPFRITTDLAGGSPNNVVANGQTGAPTTNGIVTFQPDLTHPSLLFYSCEFHQFMGYNVNIADAFCTEDLTDLHAGVYSVLVTDANGCTATQQFTVGEPAAISIIPTVTDARCSQYNGAIDLDITGGSGTYQVCWDTVNTQNGPFFGVTFGPKTAAHPLFGQGSGNGYIIDGIEGKELFLNYGVPYDFSVAASNHPFRITTDLAGGSPNNVVTNGQVGAPTQNGIVTFTPDITHPSLLYYSCEFHQFMGYHVNIDQGYCTEDLTDRHSGIYTAVVVDDKGCSATISVPVGEVPIVPEICANGFDDDCNGIVDDGCPVTLNLKVFLEGYYISNGLMEPVLSNVGLTMDQTLCDSIIVELHESFAPYNLTYSEKVILHTNGTVSLALPYIVLNQNYYLIIRQRNSVEIWSKNPLLFDSFTKNFDFTTD